MGFCMPAQLLVSEERLRASRMFATIRSGSGGCMSCAYMLSELMMFQERCLTVGLCTLQDGRSGIGKQDGAWDTHFEWLLSSMQFTMNAEMLACPKSFATVRFIANKRPSGDR